MKRAGRTLVVASALGSLGLTLLLLPRVPGIGDSAEFTLALALAGVPHPTGYPLYVLVGHLFVRVLHALGASWVTAANLWSAMGAAVAAGAYARLAQHLAADAPGGPAGAGPAAAGTRALQAAAPVLLLVLNPVWIASATVAEVYGWSHAWIAAAAAFAIGWLRRLSAAGAGPAGEHAAADRRAAWGWGILCGLGLAHHATSVFFAVPLTLALAAALVASRRWRAGFILAAIPAAAIPAAGALWIAWRAAHPAVLQWPIEPIAASVWQHVRGAAYGRYLGRFSPRSSEWTLIRDAILPWLPGIVITAFHALRLPRELRWGMLALVGGAALLVAFVVSYGVPDPAMFFAPALMVALLAIVPATAWVAKRASPAMAAAVVAVLAIALGSWSVPRALRERRRLDGVDARIRAAWSLVPFERGIVLWRDDHYQRLEIFQLLEGQRPGLYVDNPNILAWPARRAAFEQRFGFDPVEGELRTRADVDRIAGNVARRSPLPVVEFQTLIERTAPVR
ncbi:MAG TPA: DUF2723 domain-containing protein [Candidatus Eisenbacteria bacterium]|jgi:hypothetical protein